MDDVDIIQQREDSVRTLMEPYAEETETLTQHYTVFLGIIRTETGWEDLLMEEVYNV